MDLREVVELRHSVRAYKDMPIDEKNIENLKVLIQQCNKEGDLHFQLITNEPKAFSSLLAKYGKFRNVKNYVAVVGKKADDTEERAGYYGEKIVIHAQQLGINTCWVAGTYKKVKEAISLKENEKIYAVIAIGYGENQGKQSRSKKPADVYDAKASRFSSYEETPDWFKRGVEMALLAPTSINQQKFTFALTGDRVKAKAGFGPNSKIDLGIVKYHFEIGASPEHFVWK